MIDLRPLILTLWHFTTFRSAITAYPNGHIIENMNIILNKARQRNNRQNLIRRKASNFKLDIKVILYRFSSLLSRSVNGNFFFRRKNISVKVGPTLCGKLIMSTIWTLKEYNIVGKSVLFLNFHKNRISKIQLLIN